MDAGCATIIFVHEDLAFVEQLKKAGVEVDSFVEPSRQTDVEVSSHKIKPRQF
jgi:hypothetical protein